MRCLLIADDLTGACDAAIQFRLRGARTMVATSSVDITPGSALCDVLALNTESRGLAEIEIRRRIASLSHWKAPVIFKKIDSLMRGNPAAEIAAAREAFGFDEAIVTPTLPALGRRVVDGRLLVDAFPGWEPLDVSSIARDAATDADLRLLVQAGFATGRRILWAGSAGLASALAEEMLGPVQPPQPPPPVTGEVVFCIGSDHPVTLAQRALLLQRGYRVVTAAEVSDPAGPLLITGGDTAALVCRALRADAIELEGEILTGLPWGRIAGGPFDGLPVATKSGAFGAPDALLRVAAFFGTHRVSSIC
jgi:uncharacterized protein YgbK (DUF1537 family)